MTTQTAHATVAIVEAEIGSLTVEQETAWCQEISRRRPDCRLKVSKGGKLVIAGPARSIGALTPGKTYFVRADMWWERGDHSVYVVRVTGLGAPYQTATDYVADEDANWDGRRAVKREMYQYAYCQITKRSPSCTH